MKNKPLLTIIFVIIMLLILSAGTHPWTSWLAAIILCTTYLFNTVRYKISAGRYRIIELCFLVSIIFLVIMLLPMPASLSRLTGTTRYAQNHIVADALHKEATLVVENSPTTHVPLFLRYPLFSMTRNRAGTMRNAILLSAIFSIILLASQLKCKQRIIIMETLCWLGGILAVAGYISLKIIPQGDTIWWVYKIPHYLPGPVLCFVNRNHFAGYLAMLSVPALALFFYNITEKHFFRALCNLLLFALISPVMALTLSRGAVVAYCVGLFVLLLIYILRKQLIPAFTMIIIGGLLAVTIVTIASPQFKERMQALRAPLANGNFTERIDEWKTCFTIWKTYPLIGAGPDAYRMVFPQHRTTSRREYATHAENEYLQLIADTGIVGMIIFCTLIIALIIYINKSRKKSDCVTTIFPAAAGAIAVAATHASCDFAMHLPLYGITVGIFIGLLLDAPDISSVTTTSKQNSSSIKSIHHPHFSLAVLFAIILLLVLSFDLRKMRIYDSPLRMMKLDKITLAKVLTWAPSSWQAWYYFGFANANTPKQKAFGEYCVTRASELNPNNYVLWLSLGQLRYDLKMIPKARLAFKRAKALRFWVDIPTLPPANNNNTTGQKK